MKGLSWWPSKRVISTAPSAAPIIPRQQQAEEE